MRNRDNAASRRRPTITFRIAAEEAVIVQVDRSDSVMSFARDANIPGIVGRCGGFATCGTCHMYASKSNSGSLIQTPEEEADVILGMGEDLRPESRLTCQISVDPNSADLEFRVPE